MAGRNVPEDKEALAAFRKLQRYNLYKSRQTQCLAESQIDIDADLLTVETWAADKADDGKAWAQRKENQSNEDIKSGEQWNEKVRQDEKEAAEEAEARRDADPAAMKKEMFKVLDDYESALQDQVKAEEPWAKDKLAAVQKEHAAAKKTIDEKLEPTLERSAANNARRRRRNKAVAKKMNERKEAGQKWKDDYGDQPEKHPGGQREDVRASLDHIKQWAEQVKAQIEPLQPQGAQHIKDLTQVETWAGELQGQLDAQTQPAIDAAKQSGQTGVAHARATRDKIEKFLEQAETDGNESRDVFNRWTLYNNKLAIEWAKSDSAPHRQWAQTWFDTWKQK